MDKPLNLLNFLFFFFFVSTLKVSFGGTGSRKLVEENPFTANASLIRYWNKQIPNDLPKPSFLLSKASPLSSVDSTYFVKLIEQNTLSSNLPKFCLLANLFCFTNPMTSLDNHDSHNPDIAEVTFERNELESKDDNLPIDSRRELVSDSRSHNIPFFYDGSSSRSIPFFYDGSSGRSIPFFYDGNGRKNIPFFYNGKSHSNNLPFYYGGNNIPFFYDGSNRRSIPFFYDGNGRKNIPFFYNGKSHSNNLPFYYGGNNIPFFYDGSNRRSIPFFYNENKHNSIPFFYDGNSRNKVPFFYDGSSRTNNVPIFLHDGSNPHSNNIPFLYDGSNPRSIPFFYEGSRHSSIPFVYKHNNRRNIPFFYDDDDRRNIPFFYDGNKHSNLPFYYDGNNPIPFFYRYNGDRGNNMVETGTFFRESMLKERTIMPLPDIRDKKPKRSFLPRSISSKLPFSTDKVSELKQVFHVSENSIMGSIMAETLEMCERAPSRGETKRCVGSVEDMIDLAVSVLGNNVVVRSIESTNGSKGDVMIGLVKKINDGRVTNAVSCHQGLFPYMVYHCHSVPKVRVYEADMLDVKTQEKINHGVAICHLDTSDWNPDHAAFVALRSSPGQTEICHWIFEGDMIWTTADGV